MQVTKHAVDRYLEREDGEVCQKILDIVRHGEQVFPVKHKSSILLMNNGYKDATYWFYKGLIAVVVDNSIVTVIKRIKNTFTSKNTVK
jgi:hypothetical protein